MDSTSIVILNKILADSTVENRYFVTVNPIHSVVIDHAIPIKLPFLNDTTLHFSTGQIKYSSDSSYVWHGDILEVDSLDIHTGYGTLISREGKKFGSFLVDSLNFDLIDLGGNHNILVQYKYDSTETQCGIGLVDSLFPIPEQPDSTLLAEYRGTGPCPIKVLILFSTRVDDQVPDIQQTAETSFEITLNALYDSNIRDSDFYLELVGIELLQNFDELIEMGGVFDQNQGGWVVPPRDEALWNLRNYIDGEIQNTNSFMSVLKRNADADIVILLCQITNWILDIKGWAFPGLDEDRPIGLVDARNSTKNWVFAHELGHVFGCLHEDCHASWSSLPPACAEENINARHPHRWHVKRWGGLSQRERFSIMFSEDSKKTRGYFSNPDVKYHNGKKTGSQTSNNAHWLREVGCVISNWEENETLPLFAYISGPTMGCPCAWVTVNANVQGGGPGAYSYSWSYSYDGFNFTDYPYNSSSAGVQMPCFSPPYTPEYGEGLYFRLEVTDSYNDTYTSWFYVKLDVEDEHGALCWFSRTILPYKEKLEISVFPNPTSGDIHIETESFFEDAQKLNLRLSNVAGQLLYSDDWSVVHGINRMTIEMETYPAGIYFLTLSNNSDMKEIETFTIVLQ